MRVLLTLLLALVVAGCASAPTVIDFHPGTEGLPPALVWPGSPEPQKLEYAGMLLGEQNFVRIGTESTGKRLLRWLTGLGDGEDRIEQLVRPQSGVVDSSGRILVTDSGNPSVFVFDEANGSYEVWREAMSGLDFLSPVGIAEHPSGGYLVVDADLAAVFFLSPDGMPLGRFTADELLRPTGLAIDADNGNVYVADKDASHVKVYSPRGELLQTIGEPGTGEGQLNAPLHVHVGGDRLFVSDALNANVQVFAKDDGRLLGQIGRRGLYVGNLVRPKGVTTDSDGNLYIVESYYDHLLIYNQAGEFLLPIGGTGTGIGQFFLPAGVWSDERDRIFVADMFNARVVIFRYVGGDA